MKMEGPGRGREACGVRHNPAARTAQPPRARGAVHNVGRAGGGKEPGDGRAAQVGRHGEDHLLRRRALPKDIFIEANDRHGGAGGECTQTAPYRRGREMPGSAREAADPAGRGYCRTAPGRGVPLGATGRAAAGSQHGMYIRTPVRVRACVRACVRTIGCVWV